MPLQPRRTWSAEDERRKRLEEDPDAYDVGPHSVTCAGCHRPIRLNATGRYYAANWNKHKMGCKNTNAVSGAGAITAESRFTGRVAAFRVAKPSESSEPFTHSPAPGASDTELLSSSQALNRASAAPASMIGGTASQLAPTTLSPLYPNQALDYQTTTAGRRYALKSSHQTSSSGRPLSLPAPRPEHLDTSLVGTEKRLASSYPPRMEKVKEGGDAKAGYAMLRSPQSVHESTRPIAGHVPASRGFTPVSSSQRALPTSVFVSDEGKGQQVTGDTSSSTYSRRAAPSYSLYATLSPQAQSSLDKQPHPSRPQPFPPNLHRVREAGASSSGATPKASLTKPPFSRRSLSPFPGKATPSPPPDFHSESSSVHSGTADDAEPSYRTVVRGYDSRTLPSLSSLTLQRTGDANLPSSSSRGQTFTRGHRDSSSYAGANMNLPPLGHQHRSGWRDHTLARSQESSSSTSDSNLGQTESVVLPPIWTVTHTGSPRVSPTGTKRRSEEDGGYDRYATTEDKPSPPKMYAHSGGSSDRGLPGKHPTLPSGDTSPRRRISRSAVSPQSSTSSGPGSMVKEETSEDTSTDGASLRAPSPPYGLLSEVHSAEENAGRLHPVWKWEQRGGSSNSLLSAQPDAGEERDNDIEMSARDVS
ncbi:hypothetical protein M0805_004123 [Coniferiporia weirii]|nr:hypothetical protein M0805_004123 [Coniferiporia weirii]